jgi:hypothetical protein
MYIMPPWNSINGVHYLGEMLSDPIDSFLPNFYFLKEGLHKMQLYLWNPYVAMGTPSFVSFMSQLLYPPNWLILILPLSAGLLAQGYIRILVCLFGMYLFLGRLGLRPISKVVGAVVFTFSAPMIVWFNWPHTYVAAFAPLLFYFVDKAVVEGNVKATFTSIIVLAIMFYAGMPPYVAYFLYLLAPFVLYRLISIYAKNYRGYLKPALLFTSIVFFGSGLSFAYTGSLVEQVKLLGYLQQRVNFYTVTLGVDYLKEFVFPGKLQAATMAYNEYALYFGIIPLILVLLSFIYLLKDKLGVFWMSISIFIFLMIFTHHLDILAKHLPVINTSIKIRLLMILTFTFAVISALVFDKILTPNKQNLRVFSIVNIIVILLALIYNSDGTYFKSASLMPIYMYLGFILVYYIIGMGNINTKYRMFAACLLVCFIGVDLLSFGIGFNPIIERNAKTIPQSDSIDFLKSHSENYRFVAIGKWSLFPNTSVFYNISDLRGHDFIETSDRVENFMKSIDAGAYDTKTRTSIKNIDDTKPLNLASVKYIAKLERSDEIQTNMNMTLPEKKPVGEITKDIKVIEKFISEKNGLSDIEVLLAIYNRKFLNPPVINFALKDTQSGMIISQQSVSASLIKDNSYFKFSVDPISDSKGKEYELIITSPDAVQGNAITAWASNNDIYTDGSLKINEASLPGDLFLKIHYYVNDDNNGIKLIKEFNDGTYLYENTNALPRAYISHFATVEPSPDKVIEVLKTTKNLTDIVLEKEPPIKMSGNNISKDEYCKISSFTPDKIVIEAKLSSPGFVVLTDNFYPGWEAKVNGTEGEIYRTNSIFKSVFVPSGINRIEFEFKPTYFYRNVYISLAFLIALGVLLFYYRVKRLKMQKALIKEK